MAHHSQSKFRRIVVAFAMFATIAGVSAPEVTALSSGIPASNTVARAASKKFSTGWAHACVLREDGFPVCWGGDQDGGIDGIYGSHVVGDASSDMGWKLGAHGSCHTKWSAGASQSSCCRWWFYVRA